MNFIKLIFFFFVMISLSYGMNNDADSTRNKLPISIKFGYKSPTDNSFHSTVAGFCFSISTDIELSEKYLIQPSFLLWNSKYKYITPYNENVTLTTVAAFLKYQIDLEEIILLPKIGVGFSKASDTGKQLLSALYGVEINYIYESSITMQFEILNHLSAVPDVGGTSQSFAPVLISLGFQFFL